MRQKDGTPNKVYEFMITDLNTISDVKQRLREETQKLFPQQSMMLSALDQCEHMKFLVKLMNAKKGIEIGTFTGYSALCLAEGLPEDGKLICLDISEQFTSVGKKYWKQAGVDKKIDLILGDGIQTLDKLLADNNNLESFDFAYIDADKGNYPNYYNKVIKLIRKGGLIIYDNMLWGGSVADENSRKIDQGTRSIYQTHQLIKQDDRVDYHTIYLADGIVFAYKK